jgi:hypothetical protein
MCLYAKYLASMAQVSDVARGPLVQHIISFPVCFLDDATKLDIISLNGHFDKIVILEMTMAPV